MRSTNVSFKENLKRVSKSRKSLNTLREAGQNDTQRQL